MSTPTETDPKRRTFAPVVLGGLGATGLAALAGHQQMLRVPADDLEKLGLVSAAGADIAEVGFPLAGALSLVALACWGVLLVARGGFRQVMAAVAALSAGGVFAVLIVGGFLQNDDAATDIADQLGVPLLADRPPLDATPWFWLGLLASVVSVAAAVSAVWLAPAWPEMGKRYDAPSTGRGKSSDDTPAEERTSLDLWKSMDEGDDPTER
jgi:uncharacterized membrane protein (TIGR02234 family)